MSIEADHVLSTAEARCIHDLLETVRSHVEAGGYRENDERKAIRLRLKEELRR